MAEDDSVPGIDYTKLLEEIGLAQRSRQGSFEAILRYLEGRPLGRVLDAPCGPGLLSETLRRLGHNVTAVDLDDDLDPHPDIDFRALDLDEPLPFSDQAFDVVICGDGIEHMENHFGLIREFSRVLRANGYLYIATPNYLDIERRLKFFLTGSMARPLPRRRGTLGEPKRPLDHINPVTLTRLAHIAEGAGLDLVRSKTVSPRRKRILLAPLAVLVRVCCAFLPSSRKQNLFFEHTHSMEMLLGKVLIAEFRRRESV